MTTKVDSKGDPINRNRRASASASVDVDTHQDADVDTRVTAASMGKVLMETLTFFAEHEGGFLKMRRGTLTDDLHIAYTWTAGKNRDTYVYVCYPCWRFVEGMDMLMQKVLDVESGRRRPTPDKYKT